MLPCLPTARSRRLKGTVTTPRINEGSTDDTWVLRFYEEAEGKRVYRKQRIGTVKEFLTRRDAEKAVLTLRAKINAAIRMPETVNELINHYKEHELTEQSGKQSST